MSVVATRVGRPRVLVGAWLLSGATIAAGLLTYAFLVLAARTLGPHAYGRVAALWGAIFIGAVVLYRPLEQTASRTIADRLARGHDGRSVLRALAIVGSVAVALTAAIVLVAWRPLTDRLFLGDPTLTLLLLCGTIAYGISYVIRGVVGGVRWFGGYGLVLVADGVARLAVAAPLVLVASAHLAGAAMVTAGIAGAVVPFVFGRGRLRVVLAVHGSQSFEVRSAFAFAGPATAIAAADQLLVNGGPLLVILDGGAQAARSAGIVFAATMLVRAPIYVFSGLAASILPNLTTLAAGAARSRNRARGARRAGRDARDALAVRPRVLGRARPARRACDRGGVLPRHGHGVAGTAGSRPWPRGRGRLGFGRRRIRRAVRRPPRKRARPGQPRLRSGDGGVRGACRPGRHQGARARLSRLWSGVDGNSRLGIRTERTRGQRRGRGRRASPKR
jgi:hypothetical protein